MAAGRDENRGAGAGDGANAATDGAHSAPGAVPEPGAGGGPQQGPVPPAGGTDGVEPTEPVTESGAERGAALEAVSRARTTDDAATAPAVSPETAGDPPPPRPPGRLRRLRERFNAASATDKIAVAGLVLALVPLLTPVAAAGYEAVFGDEDPVTLLAAAYNDPCLSEWIITPGHEELGKAFGSVTSELPESLDRWELEGSITHHSTVKAMMSARGNTGRSVQLRDISITVTRRTAPLPGTLAPRIPCGDSFNVGLYVDLDTLPVGLPVSYRHLQSSPQQGAARAEAAKLNGEDISLPYDLSDDSFFAMVLTGRSLAHYTEWHATLTWWDGDALHTTDITNGKGPFRVSATASGPPAGTP
ncbi:hypothetical protein OG462_03955 [Streptomyces sp. NBC_01077]|uniref:hypothetical protein n=1 Tax=Streptomyces sp. NBC_01077 TaxID=2903746 RepID=UPI00386A5AB2|nr:hypothetical protein OG462_03955 [Streptomyces sp. NBC_01077]